jgi:glycosyltransferase involved in cell wall biosynthesis
VIVPSEFSRGEVIELCGADPERVTVVLGGVPDRYRDTAAPAKILDQFGIAGPYVLTVASKVRRKNLSALEPVAKALAMEGVSLVAVGGGRPQFGVAGTSHEGSVIELGPLDESLLPDLYSGALAFVLPSIYEGFGLPVCEAMACSTPVVCSNMASLPEAAGGAALLADPFDQEELVAKVFEACFDSDSRQRLISAGLRRVAGLTWQATAEAVDSVCARY